VSGPGALRGRRGQTAVEYLMIAGLMTAMLIVLSNIIIPTMRWVGVVVTEHVVMHLTSPPFASSGLQPCPEFVEPEDDMTCVKQ
jgi:hypothetical protein